MKETWKFIDISDVFNKTLKFGHRKKFDNFFGICCA
jgi:hypothetical protein